PQPRADRCPDGSLRARPWGRRRSGRHPHRCGIVVLRRNGPGGAVRNVDPGVGRGLLGLGRRAAAGEAVRGDLRAPEADGGGGERRGGGWRRRAGDGVRPGAGGAGGKARLSRGAPRTGRGNGDAAPSAARRGTHRPLPAADRRGGRAGGGGPGGGGATQGCGGGQAGELTERALAWARSLAEGGPQALANTKAILQRLSRQAVSVEETAQASAAPRLTEECRQGMEAFFAKRPAPWAPPTA